MHSGWRSSGRRLLAIGLGGLGGLGIALSISPAGVVDAIDPSVRTLRNLGFGGAVAFGIVQVLVAVSGVFTRFAGRNAHSGTDGLQTPRWRETDSNPWSLAERPALGRVSKKKSVEHQLDAKDEAWPTGRQRNQASSLLRERGA